MIKNIIITGASSSIGNFLIKKLIKLPVKLICQYQSNNKELKKFKKLYPDKIQLYKSNFNNIDEICEFANGISAFEEINALVHLPSRNLEIKKHKNIKWIDFQNHFTVQVASLHILTSKIISNFTKLSPANIIVLGSEGTKGKPPSGMIDYLSSKGMLEQYCKCLNSEYLSKGIRTTLISPPMFKSPLLEKLPSFIIEKNTESNGENLINIEKDIIPIIYNIVFNKTALKNKKIIIN